ncbi:MAG TPA: hypothetical protein VF483_09980 [Gemmatimonadaceae bacterium]
MSHLPIERLAALADEQPNTIESAHLAQCAECARELDAIRSLVSLAGAERENMSVPLTRWDTLSSQLRSEGLIDGNRAPQGIRGRRVAFRFSSRTMLQVAAGFLLVAVGVGAGRLSTGNSMLPGGLSGNEPTRSAKVDSMPSKFQSVADASYWQQVYADRYQSAIDYLMTHDSTTKSGTPSAMRTRLSAMDRASATMREALAEAPFDPVINDFYLNSVAQREAALRQLNTALPQGVRLNSF